MTPTRFLTPTRFFIAQRTRLPIASLLLAVAVGLHVQESCGQEYGSSVVGTDFDFITAEDPSAFLELVFVRESNAEMPDKRDDDRDLFQPAFIFRASFVDAARKGETAPTGKRTAAVPKTIDLFIDAAFGTRNAARAEAMRYVDPLGKLPSVLRRGVDRVVVHRGGPNTTAFSDVGLIVMYSENATARIGTHDLEETTFHESVHAAWDARHARSPAWRRAQAADGNFITVYARRQPDLEDLAESALFAHTLTNHPERIPQADRERIRQTIPHRIAFIAELLTAETTGGHEPADGR